MVLLSRQFQITPNYSVHTSAKTPCKKTILTITSPLLNLSGNLPTQCSKPPIFKLTGFNLRKENCKFTWSATAPRFCISAQHWGQLWHWGKGQNIYVPFQWDPTKVGSHSYRNGYHDSYQMSVRTTQQRSVFFPVFKECSGLRNLIYPHAILFQKFKKGKKVAVNNQELRSRRKLHWK